MKKHNSIITMAISAALLGSSLGGCGGDNPDTLIASSKEYLAKSDSKAAIIQLKNALQSNPNLGEARYLLGKALLDSGDIAGAIVELRKAADQKYSPDQVIPLLASAMLVGGEAKKMLTEFEKTTLSTPEANASLKTVLAQAHFANGNRSAARALLAEALSAKSDFAPALISKARIVAGEGNIPEAKAIVDAVIASQPKDHDAYLLAGAIESSQGNTEEAIRYFKKAIEVRPHSIPPQSAIVSILFQTNRYDEAAQAIENMKKVAPKHPQTIYLEATASYQQKNYKKTRELTQQLLKFSPNNAMALQLAGAAEFQLGSYIQAETYLTRALQKAPTLAMARRLLVSSYLRSGQPTKAVEALQPAMGTIESDSALLSIAGEAYLQTGDAKKAAELLNKASKLDPESKAKKTSLAVAHLAQGNAESAFSELEQLSKEDDKPTADLALIAAYIQSNQLDKALKSIDALEKKQPNNPATYNLKARTQVAKKDIAGARKSFEKSLSLNPAFFQAAAGLAALDLAEKKPDEAKKRFESVIAADPKNSQAILALAELNANTGVPVEQVATQISKAISATPEDVAPRLALIQLHLKNKDNKKALNAANDAVAAMPDKPELLDALGRVQQMSGDLNQALSTYGKLSTLQPASPLPSIRIAEIHLANKNKDDAKKALKKALEIKPDLLDAQRALIALALDAKNVNEALEIARQVQTQRPKEAIGYIMTGDIYASQKNWGESIAAFRNGLKQVPVPELAVKLYGAISMSGNQAEAEKMANAWFKEHPKDITLRLHLGDLASARKEYPLASQHYKVALETQPNSPLLLNNLAWVSSQLKQPKAIEYAEKANQLAPNQPPFMDTLAMILADQGRTDQAIVLFRKALEISPQAYLIQLNLAKTLIRVGKKDDARKELEALAKLGDKFPAQSEVTELQKSL